VERRDAETEFRDRLAAKVDEHHLGVEVVDTRFLDVHAPASVHDAFRDVASALEDREREIHLAQGYLSELTHEAEGEVVAIIAGAEASADRSRKIAAARTDSFALVAAEHAATPDLTEFRLRLETIDRSMADIQKYIHASPSRSADVDLWLGSGLGPGLLSAPVGATDNTQQEAPENGEQR
jgi:membrane protease subunit HflK